MGLCGFWGLKRPQANSKTAHGTFFQTPDLGSVSQTPLRRFEILDSVSGAPPPPPRYCSPRGFLTGLKWPWLENWGVNVSVQALLSKHSGYIWDLFEGQAAPRLPCVLMECWVHFGYEGVWSLYSEIWKMFVRSPGGPCCCVTHSWAFESGVL